MSGLSTMVSISFGIALVAGRTRVPRPATGNTALRIFMGLIGRPLGRAGTAGQPTAVGSRFAAANKGQYGARAGSREGCNGAGKSRHVKLLETASRPPECLKSGATAGIMIQPTQPMARLAAAILLAAALLLPGVVKAQSSGGGLSDLFGGIFSGLKSD